MKMLRFVLFCLIFMTASTASAAGIRLREGTEVLFATKEEAARRLAARDDFMERMTPYDRSLRLRSAKQVSPQNYRTFVQQHGAAWTRQEQERLAAIFGHIRHTLIYFRGLPLPPQVVLVKTTGREEGHAAYTRGNGIFLPTGVMKLKDDELEKVVVHELFHVMTRHTPQLRDALYAAIGFTPCSALELPKALQTSLLTNPDTPPQAYAITLTSGERTLEAVPVTFCACDSKEFARKRDFFDFWWMRLIEIERVGTSCRAKLTPEGEPVTHRLAEVDGFFEKTGSNTDYVVHPEEILADNFVLLLTGEAEGAPSPQIPSKMWRILQQRVNTEKPN